MLYVITCLIFYIIGVMTMYYIKRIKTMVILYFLNENQNIIVENGQYTTDINEDEDFSFEDDNNDDDDINNNRLILKPLRRSLRLLKKKHTL